MREKNNPLPLKHWLGASEPNSLNTFERFGKSPHLYYSFMLSLNKFNCPK